MVRNMTDFENYIQYIKDFHTEAASITEAKCLDYAGELKPLKNFENSALIAGITVEQGLLVRMADKLARARTLTESKSNQGHVTNEKLQDTLKDLSNYAAILSYYAIITYEDSKQLSLFPNEFDKEDDLLEALGEPSSLSSYVPEFSHNKELTALGNAKKLF